MAMEISFDYVKDRINLDKYGVSLVDAKLLQWSSVMVKPDTRKDYKKLREIGYGLIGERLYCVVFVRRADVFHIISLRKANSREVRDYVSET
jgi:uncharacterized DUF497 family protein